MILSLQVNPLYNRYVFFAFAGLYPTLLILAIPEYFIWSENVLMGLALAPYICLVEAGRYSLRYLIPATLFVGVAVFIPVRTTFFLAVLFSGFFLVETFLGKISSALLFLLLLISPIFKYFSNALGFPIRLWLSEVAVVVLNFAGVSAEAFGNIIFKDHSEFAVDQACAGLNMLTTSLIICLFIIAYYKRRHSKELSFLCSGILLFVTVLLNILCNLLRILLLVNFEIMPGKALHDIVGILCLLLYVILPLLLIANFFFQRLGPAIVKDAGNHRYTPFSHYTILNLFLLIALIYISFNLKNIDKLTPSVSRMQISGYQKTALESGILKFENNFGLVYLKSVSFYAPEHDPMICWKGSGYTFKSIRKEQVGEVEVYTGILEKGRDKIYSSWWFASGSYKTINQLGWRWKAVKSGENFYLINANAESPLALRNITKDLLNRN